LPAHRFQAVAQTRLLVALALPEIPPLPNVTPCDSEKTATTPSASATLPNTSDALGPRVHVIAKLRPYRIRSCVRLSVISI
jgi:hypothetical protein